MYHSRIRRIFLNNVDRINDRRYPVAIPHKIRYFEDKDKEYR